jgi:pseudouridine 5'-phosphatase
MAPHAVVFDMDGLMFNTEDVYTLVGTELLRRRGYDFGSDLKDAMMGLPPQAAFQQMIAWHNLPDRWDALELESNEIFIRLLPQYIEPMPGLLKLLSALEGASMPKAIATSSCRQLALACLNSQDFLPRFRFVLTSEDIVHGKPNPEIYLKAAARLGFQPGEILVLEDSENGCRAAAAAGAFTVAVPGEHSRRQNFDMASLRIDSLADPRLYAALQIAQENRDRF